MNLFIQSLTYFRIFTAPIIFLLITYFHFYGLALIFFIFSSASDYWDGFFARKYNLESKLGEILDPIADKILTSFLLFSFAIELSSTFIALAGAIIIAREFWVSALRDLNARNQKTDLTKVTLFAKAKTATQFVTFFCYILALYTNSALLLFISNFLLILALVITIQTGLSYTTATFRK
jgi:CDP-diacylglycerol--glycerol-3-phosphate 3-phosphatidyltransferase